MIKIGDGLEVKVGSFTSEKEELEAKLRRLEIMKRIEKRGLTDEIDAKIVEVEERLRLLQTT